MANNNLSKKVILKSYINWMMYNLALYQPETMQAPALVKMFGDIREDLYPGQPEKQKEFFIPFILILNIYQSIKQNYSPLYSINMLMRLFQMVEK